MVFGKEIVGPVGDALRVGARRVMYKAISQDW